MPISSAHQSPSEALKQGHGMAKDKAPIMIDLEDKEAERTASSGEIAALFLFAGLSYTGYINGFHFWEWAPGAWRNFMIAISG